MSRYSIAAAALALASAIPAPSFAQPAAPTAPVAQAEQGAPPRSGDAGKRDDRRTETRRWMWWRVAETRTELAITDQQSADIDQIFQAAMPQLRTAKEELDKLDAEVAQVIKAAAADDATVSRLVGRAEHARARLLTTRTVMFYRMHRVLSAEQRAKLNAMLERWDAERRKTTDSSRR